MSEKIPVTGCIVTYNSAAEIEKCIDSVLRFTRGVDFRLYVSNNSSSDGTAELVREKFPAVTVLTGENIGFCYDSGHHLCATPEADFEALYPRMLCCHLHDNHGGKNERMETDEHLLPFEGLVDFSARMKQIKNAGYTGNLTIETGYKERFRSAAEFMRAAYTSAERLRRLFGEC